MRSIQGIIDSKGGRKLTMLTAYDYTFAGILDESGVDMILVGDSLANVVLGLEETRKVSLSEMLNHTSAVAKASRNCLVVADMPYTAYQKYPLKSAHYARRFLDSGAAAVKVEWFRRCPVVIEKMVKRKIPVMGHIGLTPQTVHLLGGYKVQGKTKKAAADLLDQAKLLQDLGCFSIVLECIPAKLAKVITASVKIPTIGIGAGPDCDGQVLVLYDLLGLYQRKKLKFVRAYRDLFSEVKGAVGEFIRDVAGGRFPASGESFTGGYEAEDTVP